MEPHNDGQSFLGLVIHVNNLTDVQCWREFQGSNHWELAGRAQPVRGNEKIHIFIFLSVVPVYIKVVYAAWHELPHAPSPMGLHNPRCQTEPLGSREDWFSYCSISEFALTSWNWKSAVATNVHGVAPFLCESCAQKQKHIATVRWAAATYERWLNLPGNITLRVKRLIVWCKFVAGAWQQEGCRSD